MSLDQSQTIVPYDAEKKRKRGGPSEKDFTVATVDEVLSLKKRSVEATKRWLYKQEDIAEKIKSIPNDVLLQLLLAPSSRFKFKHITIIIDDKKYVLYLTTNSIRNHLPFRQVVVKTAEGVGTFFYESQPLKVRSWKTLYGVLFGKTLGELMMLERNIITDAMASFCGSAITEAAIFLATLSESDLKAFSSLFTLRWTEIQCVMYLMPVIAVQPPRANGQVEIEKWRQVGNEPEETWW